MARLAGSLVVVGVVLLFLASELVDDLFFGALISERFRRWAPAWMRRGIVMMIAGVALILAGIVLLRYAS